MRQCPPARPQVQGRYWAAPQPSWAIDSDAGANGAALDPSGWGARPRALVVMGWYGRLREIEDTLESNPAGHPEMLKDMSAAAKPTFLSPSTTSESPTLWLVE